jgi:cell division septation protein DedD
MAWRDDVSEGSQSDLDTVFSQAALLARTLLMRNREFFPFAATLSTKGAVGLSTPVPAAATPTVHDVIDAITTELEHDKAGKRAYAIVALARTADGGEAVRIELEHKEGVALVIGMPVIRGESGAVTFGDMAAHPGQRLIWPPKAASKAAGKSAPKFVEKSPAKPTGLPAAAARASAAPKAAPKRAGAVAPKAKPSRKPRGTAIATA